jgi:hypothetical protein
MSRFRAEEPPVDEMLDDPIVQLLMRRDGIGPDEVLSTLEEAHRRLRRSSRAADASDRILPAGI